MNGIWLKGFALAGCLLWASTGFAQDGEKTGAAEPARPAAVELLPLLDAVAGSSGKQFLLDARIRPQVVVGQLDTRRLTYPLLLSVLRNNGMAAVTLHDVVNIVPQEEIRQHPLPLVNADDPALADDEWVRRIIQVEHAAASHFVPIIRPLLPPSGHMAAFPATNQIIIVDRYGNVRRISEMIRQMDREPLTRE